MPVLGSAAHALAPDGLTVVILGIDSTKEMGKMVSRKTMAEHCLAVLLVILSICLPLDCSAKTTSFRQGDSSGSIVGDTSLIHDCRDECYGGNHTYRHATEENYGSAERLSAGYTQYSMHQDDSNWFFVEKIAVGLVRFDLTRIQGATVQSARLYLYLQIPSDRIDRPDYIPWTVGAKVVPAVDGDWVAGTSDGVIEGCASSYAQKLQGIRNWSTSLRDNWYSLPAGCAVGTYTGQVNRFYDQSGQLTEYRRVYLDLPPSTVSLWASAPASNTGLAFYGQENYVLSGSVNNIASSNSPYVAMRPTLSVTYMMIPEPSSLSALLSGTGLMFLSAMARRRNRS
jgi:hypothetical protein